MSITALPVTAWAETPAESAVTGAEIATDHVDENAVDETTDAADQTGQETIENSEEVEQVETAPKLYVHRSALSGNTEYTEGSGILGRWFRGD